MTNQRPSGRHAPKLTEREQAEADAVMRGQYSSGHEKWGESPMGDPHKPGVWINHPTERK